MFAILRVGVDPATLNCCGCRVCCRYYYYDNYSNCVGEAFEEIVGDIISGEIVRCELADVIDSKLTLNSFPS